MMRTRPAPKSWKSSPNFAPQIAGTRTRQKFKFINVVMDFDRMVQEFPDVVLANVLFEGKSYHTANVCGFEETPYIEFLDRQGQVVRRLEFGVHVSRVARTIGRGSDIRQSRVWWTPGYNRVRSFAFGGMKVDVGARSGVSKYSYVQFRKDSTVFRGKRFRSMSFIPYFAKNGLVVCGLTALDGKGFDIEFEVWLESDTTFGYEDPDAPFKAVMAPPFPDVHPENRAFFESLLSTSLPVDFCA